MKKKVASNKGRKGKWALWVHPKSGRDDYWYDYHNKKSAIEGRKKLVKTKKFAIVEKPVLHYKRIPQ